MREREIELYVHEKEGIRGKVKEITQAMNYAEMKGKVYTLENNAAVERTENRIQK